jgi:hypothetical protein
MPQIKELHVTRANPPYCLNGSVTCVHRTEILGDVMGAVGGAQHPATLTNPVFVDVDGTGFQPNNDTLGFPLPVKFSK